MRKKRKYFKKVPIKEALYTQGGSIPLNINQSDRISFSVLRDEKNRIMKIENISYEMSIKAKWEWVVRYDDHGGKGQLHRHYRLSLEDYSDVISMAGIRKYRNKDYELTWICKDIKRKYLIYRSKLLKKMKLDLY